MKKQLVTTRIRAVVLLYLKPKIYRRFMDFSFLQKAFPSFKSSFGKVFTRPTSFVGIDIGLSSVKVVQLRRENERAILETYGQLKSDGYLKNPDVSASFGGFLRYSNEDITAMLRDILKEANVTSNAVAMSIPAHAAFITLADLPPIPQKEWDTVLQFESRRYIPIPQAEVLTNWVVIQGEEEASRMKVLFVAVPRDVIAKYQKIAKTLNLDLRAIEVESFSIVRSQVGNDHAPTIVVHFGFESTTATIVDEGIIRLNHTIDRGQDSFTTALASGLNISKERAEDLKNEIGLSDKIEQQEIVGVLEPLLEILMREIERIVIAYNRDNERKLEKVILTGGGARLKGLVDYVAKIFGIEVSVGNAFHRTVYPQFMQPILRDVSSHFSASVGLALREIEK